MDLKITNRKDNPSLSRIEVNAEVSFLKESTPKKEDIKKKIASLEKANENLLVINKISTYFGEPKVGVLAYIYKSENDLKKIEPKKKEKGAAKAEATKAEGKEEAAKEE